MTTHPGAGRHQGGRSGEPSSSRVRSHRDSSITTTKSPRPHRRAECSSATIRFDGNRGFVMSGRANVDGGSALCVQRSDYGPELSGRCRCDFVSLVGVLGEHPPQDGLERRWQPADIPLGEVAGAPGFAWLIRWWSHR